MIFCKTKEESLKNFEDNQYRDSIKNKFCEENNINLLRIKYNENIQNKINELIKDLYEKINN